MIIVKGFTGIGSIVIFIIGIAMTIVTVWAMKNSELTFDNFSYLGVLLAADFLVMIGGVIGFCGTKRANGILLAIFTLFVIVFFIGFLVMGIVAQSAPKYLFSGDCTSSPDNEYIKSAHDLYLASIGLCTSVCPCSLTDDTINNSDYNAIEKGILNALVRKDGGRSKYPDCDIADDDKNHQIFGILGAIQYSLDCSGWCDSNAQLIYRFSDVNRGKPSTTCYTTMKQNSENYAHVVGLAGLAAAAFMALVFICNICLCCSQKEKKLSDRFVVQRGGQYHRV